MGLMPSEHERHPLAGRNGELGDTSPPVALPLAAQTNRGDQPQRAGSGHRNPIAVDSVHPRHHLAVAEPHHQLDAHRHGTGAPLDQADQIQLVPAQRHAVDDGDLAVGACEDRLEHQRVASVGATHTDRSSRRSDQPPSVVDVSEQACETGIRVEPRERQPIDRPVPANQRRRRHVRQQRTPRSLTPCTSQGFGYARHRARWNETTADRTGAMSLVSLMCGP